MLKATKANRTEEISSCDASIGNVEDTDDWAIVKKIEDAPSLPNASSA